MLTPAAAGWIEGRGDPGSVVARGRLLGGPMVEDFLGSHARQLLTSRSLQFASGLLEEQ